MAKDKSDDTVLNLTVYPDEPPKSGEWVDVDEVIAHPTSEELDDGQAMGEKVGHE